MTSLTWTSYHHVPYTADPYAAERPRILVDQVAVADSATFGNQALTKIAVGGSARAAGSIHVAAPSDAVPLGPVLVCTVPESETEAGWLPDLAQWKTAGTSGTVDGRTAYYGGAGSYTSTGGSADPLVLTAPASLFNSGAYTLALMARVGTAGTVFDLTVEVSLLVGGVVVHTDEHPFYGTSTTSTWELDVLGTVYLPPTPVQYPDANTTVRFRFKGTYSLTISELYAFPVAADLSVIDAGAYSHLFIDAPSPEQPRGGYWLASTPTRANAVSGWSTAIVPGQHSFEAGTMYAFAASLGASGPTVTFDYHKAWLGSAAE